MAPETPSNDFLVQWLKVLPASPGNTHNFLVTFVAVPYGRRLLVTSSRKGHRCCSISILQIPKTAGAMKTHSALNVVAKVSGLLTRVSWRSVPILTHLRDRGYQFLKSTPPLPSRDTS